MKQTGRSCDAYIDRYGRKRGQTGLLWISYSLKALLLKYFSNIINVDFTILIESDLDKVAEGSLDWVEVVRKVYNIFYKEA